MAYYLITFSPTGGTKRTADILASAIAEQWDLINLLCPIPDIDLTPDDICLIAVPSFGGRIPTTSAERLAKIHANGARAILVCVYGNRAYEDALLELRETLTSLGFRVVAAAAFIAEHSIVRGVAAGRPDAADTQVAVDFGRAVLSKLSQPAEQWGEVPEVPGNASYRERPVMPVAPTTNEDCGHCGSCASMCPVGAIPQDDPQSTDAEKCILCMRCVDICPCDARSLPAPMLAGMAARLEQCGAMAPKQPEVYL